MILKIFPFLILLLFFSCSDDLEVRIRNDIRDFTFEDVRVGDIKFGDVTNLTETALEPVSEGEYYLTAGSGHTVLGVIDITGRGSSDKFLVLLESDSADGLWDGSVKVSVYGE